MHIRKPSEKGFFRRVWIMGGGGGGGFPSQTVIQDLKSSGQWVLACLRDFHLTSPDFDPFWATFFRFSTENPSKRLELGQTKAGNGFSTLKMGDTMLLALETRSG